MVTLFGLWEKGWLSAEVEGFMWMQLGAAYSVDVLAMAPVVGDAPGRIRQFDDADQALESLEGQRVYLSPNGDVDLSTFEHPRDAIYIFGNASNRNLGSSKDEDRIIRINTPKPIDIFAINAASIVLFDRVLKHVR